MKKTILYSICLYLLFFTGMMAAQQWPPSEIREIEKKLEELDAQISTLDEYSPKTFPEFEELERTNQLIERIDFNKRKFKLLIDQYNLIEDRIFPLLLRLSKENPGQRNLILAKLREFTGEEDKSILRIQKKINHIALLIDRLEKEMDRVQLISRAKSITMNKTESPSQGEPGLDISTKIEKLEDKQEEFEKELKSETERLKKFQEEKEIHQAKIEEKSIEIAELKSRSETSPDPVGKLLAGIAARVREIRLNGLEIPRLNTTKTFIYLSENKIDTLKQNLKNVEKEIRSLKKRRHKELQKKLLKSVVVVLIALFLVTLLIKISRQLGKRIIKRVDQSTILSPHRKQRYQTLFSIILSMIKITLWVMATLWVLGELNIDYAPFLVAAGGVSLAIGFGAQSLVKDIVAGFFILMEEQLALGDIVDIGGKAGSVERISLRTIRLRGLDGTLHIIPNGSIDKVSNLTHQWSRAVIEVGVSYDEDSEHVLSVLKDLVHEFYEDNYWRPMLIDEPVPQGILSFGDSAINFRILAKTIPGKQWDVDRELKNRIKKAFDEKGIEIPYPFTNIVDRTRRSE